MNATVIAPTLPHIRNFNLTIVDINNRGNGHFSSSKLLYLFQEESNCQSQLNLLVYQIYIYQIKS